MAIPSSEPRVGEAYTKLQITLQDLARRFESVRAGLTALLAAMAQRSYSSLEFDAHVKRVETDVVWIRDQCRGFAANRGGSAQSDLEDPLEIAEDKYKLTMMKGTPEAAVRAFVRWVADTTNACEAWCEANNLLIDVAQPPYDFTEELWQRILTEAAKEGRYVDPRLARLDEGLKELDADGETETETETETTDETADDLEEAMMDDA